MAMAANLVAVGSQSHVSLLDPRMAKSTIRALDSIDPGQVMTLQALSIGLLPVGHPAIQYAYMVLMLSCANFLLPTTCHHALHADTLLLLPLFKLLNQTTAAAEHRVCTLCCLMVNCINSSAAVGRACVPWASWTTSCPLAAAVGELLSLTCGQMITSQFSQKPSPGPQALQLTMAQTLTQTYGVRMLMRTTPKAMILTM